MGLIDERLVSFQEVLKLKLVPKRPHLSTVHRWRTRGIRGVRLEAILCGGVWFTSREAVRRFFQGTTVAAGSEKFVAGSARDSPSKDGPPEIVEIEIEQTLDRAKL